MKFFTGCVASAALAFAATAADAQALANGAMRAPYLAVSDFEVPYHGPPETLPPRGYRYGYDYERGPALLPAEEIDAVLRETGFSPLGIPHLRGYVYSIAVINRSGEDGQLLIDARDGRILRFVPSDGVGAPYDERFAAPFGPQAQGLVQEQVQGQVQGTLPTPIVVRGVPRPPAPIPHVAGRTVPMPRAAPSRGEAPPVTARPEPSEKEPEPPRQSAAVEAKRADAPATSQAPAPTIGQAKPAPTILRTQEMPPAQGLE